jgi:hypothetical protein
MLAAALIAGLFAMSAPRAAAQGIDETVIDHEDWSVVGWDDACGVGFSVLAYPRLGAAMVAEPVSTRVGTLSIAPEREVSSLTWALEADGPLSFSQRAFDKAEKDLRRGGFNRPGYPEIIQDVPVGNQPELAEKILSTETFKPRVTEGWPGADWRWAATNYNPLATCALLVFENRRFARQYSFVLIRVYNPRTRTDRAYAHASNARLQLDAGNLAAGVIEADTAARLDPQLAIARYVNATLLALSGRMNSAVTELAAAVKLDPKYAAKARDDMDFVDLRKRDDFRAIVR